MDKAARLRLLQEVEDSDLSEAIDSMKYKRVDYKVAVGRWRKTSKFVAVSGAVPPDAELFSRGELEAERKRRGGR